jgi:hypothetical protein
VSRRMSGDLQDGDMPEDNRQQHYARRPGQHTGYAMQFKIKTKYPRVWGAGVGGVVSTQNCVLEMNGGSRDNPVSGFIYPVQNNSTLVRPANRKRYIRKILETQYLLSI